MWLFQSDKAHLTDWKFSRNQSEWGLLGIVTSPTIPLCPGCSFAQSVRDLDLTTGCQGLGQINMCWGNRRCVCVPLFLCICMCTGANLLWGGSTRISIIRGACEDPLSATNCVSPPYPIIPLLLCPAPPPSFYSASVPPLSLYPSLSLCTAARSLSHPALPFTPLTSSAYTYPYHYLLHCRYFAQQLGITSPHLRAVQSWDTEHQSWDALALSKKVKYSPEHWPPPEMCLEQQIRLRKF